MILSLSLSLSLIWETGIQAHNLCNLVSIISFVYLWPIGLYFIVYQWLLHFVICDCALLLSCILHFWTVDITLRLFMIAILHQPFVSGTAFCPLYNFSSVSFTMYCCVTHCAASLCISVPCSTHLVPRTTLVIRTGLWDFLIILLKAESEDSFVYILQLQTI